jgi:DNA-binding NtrC family response regulator
MKRKIVVIDDELALLEIITDLLSSDLYAVETFSSSRKGLDYINSNPDVRLALLDYSMPVMDGETLLEEIRKSGNMVPVVFLSGNINQEFLLSALRLGASDVLEKPDGVEKIESIVTRVIEIEKRRALYYQNQDVNKKGKFLGLLQAHNNNENKAKN